MVERPVRPCLRHGKRREVICLLGTAIPDSACQAWGVSRYRTGLVRRAGSRMECLHLHRHQHQHLGWWCVAEPPRYRRLCRSDQCSIREIQPKAGDGRLSLIVMGSVPLHSHHPQPIPHFCRNFPDTTMLAIRIDHEGYEVFSRGACTMAMSGELAGNRRGQHYNIWFFILICILI